MNIGIITYHRSVSYGAFLQTYALSRYLMGMGHAVKVIDYNPAHRSSKARPWDRRLCGLHPQNLVNAYKHRCFSDYIERYLPLTERSYRTLEELRDDPPDMDAYICGSDQIWNPEHTGGSYDPAYFGCFGPTYIRRIAYAPSTGSDHLPPEFHRVLSDNVAHIDYLSVREKSGCELVTRVTSKQCAHVLDPTLLITDYGEIMTAGQIAREPYLLVFCLAHSTLLRQVLDAVKSEVDFPVLFVADHYRFWRYGRRFRFCSPGDWLNLFVHAKAVITDSFHGTAFALRFQKPFVSLSLPEKSKDRNVRITDLLCSVRLSERFLSDGAAIGNARLIAVDPDWVSVRQCLDTMIGQSAEFLSKSLST